MPMLDDWGMVSHSNPSSAHFDRTHMWAGSSNLQNPSYSFDDVGMTHPNWFKGLVVNISRLCRSTSRLTSTVSLPGWQSLSMMDCHFLRCWDFELSASCINSPGRPEVAMFKAVPLSTYYHLINLPSVIPAKERYPCLNKVRLHHYHIIPYLCRI